MMKRLVPGIMMILLLGATSVWAHGGEVHDENAEKESEVQETTLTGEVVDVFCYLSHDKEGLGKKHAKCAKKCIKGGLPVAIKVGDKLYLASMADHTAANSALLDYAGGQVTVRGEVMEQDGQRLISISSVEKAQEPSHEESHEESHDHSGHH